MPAPASASFTMSLRLYWPKSEVLDGHLVAPGGHVGEMRFRGETDKVGIDLGSPTTCCKPGKSSRFRRPHEIDVEPVKQGEDDEQQDVKVAGRGRIPDQ